MVVHRHVLFTVNFHLVNLNLFLLITSQCAVEDNLFSQKIREYRVDNWIMIICTRLFTFKDSNHIKNKSKN